MSFNSKVYLSHLSAEAAKLSTLSTAGIHICSTVKTNTLVKVKLLAMQRFLKKIDLNRFFSSLI